MTGYAREVVLETCCAAILVSDEDKSLDSMRDASVRFSLAGTFKDRGQDTECSGSTVVGTGPRQLLVKLQRSDVSVSSSHHVRHAPQFSPIAKLRVAQLFCTAAVSGSS